ncbi:MAG TPA: hypothetical protein VNB64_11900 [Solirubrobacteraceae bacterium]|nr:hypothetical protein [Solirubrobacteraceae bacterium]
MFAGATAEAVEPGATYWQHGVSGRTGITYTRLAESAYPNRIDVHEATLYSHRAGSPVDVKTLVTLVALHRVSGSARCPDNTTVRGAGWNETELRHVAIHHDEPTLQLRFDPPLRVVAQAPGQEICFAMHTEQWPADTTFSVGASGFVVPPPPPPESSATNTVTVTETQTQTVTAPPVDARAPVTGIDGPAATRLRRPAFLLTSNESGSTFRCKLDTAPFRDCSTPLRTPYLRIGRHTLRVQATDAAGNVDASPAVKSFRILLPPRRR